LRQGFDLVLNRAAKTAVEAKFLKKVIAQQRAVAIIRVRFRKNREWKFNNH
jgi:hypothetical protein